MNCIKIAQTNFAALFIGVLLVSCGGGAGDSPSITYNISGAVSGATSAGATINLTGATIATTTTDAGGNYSFANLANGSYTVSASKIGYTFNPSSSVVSVSDANVSGTNFKAVGQLNDTGINQCYGAGSNTLAACNSAGAISLNNAQDGMVGRDANAATNSNTDGVLGFSYSAVAGGCVQDNVTGLMWEVKTTDGGLRDWTKTYTNYGDSRAGDASAYPAAVNATNLCGFNDWRLPTADELQSIVDYGAAFVTVPIDTTWFPNTQFGAFWSGSSVVGIPTYAWGVDFSDGFVNSNSGPSVSSYVRLVRVGQSPTTPRYTVSADGQEVTDNRTDLIWRRCVEGMALFQGNCTGTASTFTHEAALLQAATQATSTGVAWRLPNVNELSSIADKNRVSPAIDPMAFPATPISNFWSASPVVGYSVDAWTVSFADGYVSGNGARSVSFNVRLVRSGP